MIPKYTSDWQDADFVTLHNACNEAGANVLDVLSVIYCESGGYARAHNPNGDASGVLQFMPRILIGLGWLKGDEEFRKLSVSQQLPYVRRYLGQYAKKGLTSVARVYLAVFLPAFLDHATGPDYVLVDKNKDAWNRTVYMANAGFDANHDACITVGELQGAVIRNCKGDRFNELVCRASEGALTPLSGLYDLSDLRTTKGFQTALLRLGYDPGPLDGIPGARTHSAVAHFQQDHGLQVDGIVGPRTREVLSLAVQSLPVLTK